MSLVSKGRVNIRRVRPLWFFAAGAVLLAIAGCLWCWHLNNSPEKVFWRMLSQSLSTSGVTITAQQDNGQATIAQTMQYSLGADNVSHTRTVISQETTKVVTETIGTPKADYTRYESIKTSRKGQNGKPLDVSKLVGVWAKNEPGQIFSQSALGTSMPMGGIVVPIANMTPGLRKQMLDAISSNNIYQTDFSKTKKAKVSGRMQYTYSVKIQPVAYAKLMKTFAKDIGLHDLDMVNPADYAGQQALNLEITVDVKSGHTAKVALPQSQYKQTYTSYDVPASLTLPAKTITAEELQKRLSEVH